MVDCVPVAPVVERWFHGCHTNRPITTTAMTMTAMMMGVLLPVLVEDVSFICALSSEEGDVVLAYPPNRSLYQASMRAPRVRASRSTIVTFASPPPSHIVCKP